MEWSAMTSLPATDISPSSVTVWFTRMADWFRKSAKEEVRLARCLPCSVTRLVRAAMFALRSSWPPEVPGSGTES